MTTKFIKWSVIRFDAHWVLEVTASAHSNDDNDNEREFIQRVVINKSLARAKHYGADAVVQTELSLNAVGSRHR